MLAVYFAVFYIAIDILYVAISKDAYFDIVRNIQKQNTTMTGDRYVAALAAYLAMAVGWLVLVAPRVSSPSTGLYYGIIYGLVVYGVFNCTNFVMFQNYTYRIFIQDMLWGTSWATILSVLYGYAVKQRSLGRRP